MLNHCPEIWGIRHFTAEHRLQVKTQCQRLINCILKISVSLTTNTADRQDIKIFAEPIWVRVQDQSLFKDSQGGLAGPCLYSYSWLWFVTARGYKSAKGKGPPWDEAQRWSGASFQGSRPRGITQVVLNYPALSFDSFCEILSTREAH